MKSFPFVAGGKERHLRKLDQNAKEDILDRITAGRLKQAIRMHRKGYLEPAEYLEAKQAAYVKWGTEAFVNELADDDNAKAFVRAIVAEDLDDATCLMLVREQRDPNTDMANAVKRMAEDDDPKAKAPPESASTPTGGAPSSATSPSSSPPKPSGG